MAAEDYSTGDNEVILWQKIQENIGEWSGDPGAEPVNTGDNEHTRLQKVVHNSFLLT